MPNDEITILICAEKEGFIGSLEGTVDETCVDCGCTILRKPDPEVPECAEYVCMPCGMARMAASDEVPEIFITKQNQEQLQQLGYKPRAEGNC